MLHDTYLIYVYLCNTHYILTADQNKNINEHTIVWPIANTYHV